MPEGAFNESDTGLKIWQIRTARLGAPEIKITESE